MARGKKGKAADTVKADDTQPVDVGSDTPDATPEGTPDNATDTVESVTAAPETLADAGDDTLAADTPPGPDAPVDAETLAASEHADTIATAEEADTLIAEETTPAPVAEDTLEAAMMGTGAAELASESQDDRIGNDGPAAPVAPQVVRETVVERKGGFVPMVLGGVVAAALGFVAAQATDIRLPFLPAPAEDPFVGETQSALTQQQDRLTAVETQLSEARAALDGVDMQSFGAAIAGLEDGLAATTGAVAALEDQVAAFDSRVTALEKEPLAGAVSPEAIAAYERELEELRGAIQQQRDAVDAQRAEIERMAQEAMASEQNAEQQAELAEIRTALAEVTALVQEGRPYAEPLSVVQAGGVEVPDALTAAGQDGVPTLAALAAEFPDAARDALREARTAGAAEEGGFATFLQNQLGARSVQPREGDDPDAVLSRAEAAVKSGDLDGALAEIAKLPEQAQSVMADWVAKADARRDALAAAGDLARRINQE